MLEWWNDGWELVAGPRFDINWWADIEAVALETLGAFCRRTTMMGGQGHYFRIGVIIAPKRGGFILIINARPQRYL